MIFKSTTIKELKESSESIEVITSLLGNSLCPHIEGVSEEIRKFISELNPDLKIIIESDYIDKVYRDCYYQFYAKKLHNYSRNCVRLSFFDSHFSEEEIIDNISLISNEEYKGFLILRPLDGHACIGRNIISKDALKNNDIAICQSSFDSSCVGKKFKAIGYPHSAQDGELMTCAETSIWSLLEYFGNRYAIYKPILPSEILNCLEEITYERLTPSLGLTYKQVAKVIRKAGLSSKLYDNDNLLFRQIFTCYIESGLPLAVCLDNTAKGGNITHSVICVGKGGKQLPNADLVSEDVQGKSCIQWNSNVNEFVFVDDTCNSLCKRECFTNGNNFENGTEEGDEWYGLEISSFIVPLPDKVYLDAELAINAANYYAANILNIDNDTILKTFLVSNRSYKDYIISNTDLDNESKQLICSIDFPRFVWVTEISAQVSFAKDKTNGLILMDATAFDSNEKEKLIIFSVYKDEQFIFSNELGELDYTDRILPNEFSRFNNNLK